MGLYNEIELKITKCPLCNEDMRYPGAIKRCMPVTCQSKDLYDRCNLFKQDTKIKLKFGKLTFECTGNDRWNGTLYCASCRTYMTCDIIIKNGIITEINNFKEMTN